MCPRSTSGRAVAPPAEQTWPKCARNRRLFPTRRPDRANPRRARASGARAIDRCERHLVGESLQVALHRSNQLIQRTHHHVLRPAAEGDLDQRCHLEIDLQKLGHDAVNVAERPARYAGLFENRFDRLGVPFPAPLKFLQHRGPLAGGRQTFTNLGDFLLLLALWRWARLVTSSWARLDASDPAQLATLPGPPRAAGTFPNRHAGHYAWPAILVAAVPPFAVGHMPPPAAHFAS